MLDHVGICIGASCYDSFEDLAQARRLVTVGTNL